MSAMDTPAKRHGLSDDDLRDYVTGRANATLVESVERALFETPELLDEIMAFEAMHRGLAARPRSGTTRVRRPFSWASATGYARAASVVLALGGAAMAGAWLDDLVGRSGPAAPVGNLPIVVLSPLRGAESAVVVEARGGAFAVEIAIAPPFASRYAIEFRLGETTTLLIPDLAPLGEGTLTAYVPGGTLASGRYVLVVSSAEQGMRAEQVRFDVTLR